MRVFTILLESTRRWVMEDQCRVVSLLGLGGIGKSSLAITFARRFAADFDMVLFRSLQNGPLLGQVLDQIIRAVSDQQATPPEALSDKIAQLVQLFRGRRCLLILDNFETILQPGTLTGAYRTGYADYGLFLRGLSEREHQSCLMLTSREKPTELGPLEGRSAPVRALYLAGLAESACQVVLEAKELVGTTAELHALARLYGGNPLALNLVSEPILEIFGGNVAAFLATDDAFFNGMGRLLDQQFTRSTPLEQSVMYWLAIERELVPFNVLLADVGEGVLQRDVLSALESLRRRMQIERSPDRPAFTLQPLILEYITEQLVETIHDEIMEGQPRLLPRYTLVNATAKEYVRLSQERLIATPLLEGLVASCRGEQGVTARLFALLAQWRGRGQSEQGYGPGNVVNLLRLLHGNVIGMDFSNLALSADGHLLASGSADGACRLWEVTNGQNLAILKGHTSVVWTVALSADRRLLASASYDGTVRLWDTAVVLSNLDEHARLGVIISQEYKGEAWSVALSADGQQLASGDTEGNVHLWKTGSVQEGRREVDLFAGHSSAIWSVAISPDGGLVASGSGDGTVRLWDGTSATLLRTLRAARPYERMDIRGLTGITEAQRASLIALGAIG